MIEQLKREALEIFKLDQGRVDRAVEIATKPTMIYNAKCPKGEFDVRASSGGWYHVDTNNKSCTCPDSQRGNICKHRIAVWFYVELRARPIAQLRKVKTESIVVELGYK
jgi:SWIM zinc finger